MDTREVQSYCRICTGGCGVLLQVEGNRITAVKGDSDHPMTKGYICFKGVQADEYHHGPNRLLHSLKRMPDGSFRKIPLETALDEIAEVLGRVIRSDGAESVAGFLGNGGYFNKTTHVMLQAWLAAIGSSGYFTTMTIDQSAKMVTACRLGAWGAGRQAPETSDVVMFIGNNPLISHASAGAINVDPTKTIKKEKARGLKIIVIDPRRCETAQYADIFLQPYPGEDATILAGLLRIILQNNWHDEAFCARFVAPGHLEKMRAMIEPYSPEYVAARAGVQREDLLAAAEMFAHASARGSAFSATGLAMAPHSNLSDHLVECLNVVCGRFQRAGETYHDIPVWESPPPRYAEVYPPNRTWEKMPPSRIRGARSLFGERPSATLADEILTPGEGQIKFLINSSSNIALSMPDQNKMHRALKSLELLVTIDPFMTATAKLSHYVLAPKMQYERYDLPFGLFGLSIFPVAWGQYAVPVIEPPAGSDVVDDWYIYWGLAKRLGLTIDWAGVPLDMETAPDTDTLLRMLTRNALVSLDEMLQHPGGKIFDLGERIVQPTRPEANGRFDIMPQDIADELAAIAQEPVLAGRIRSNGQEFTHRLAVRRMRNVYNTEGVNLASSRAKYPYNPAWMHPQDIAAQGLKSGDKVSIISDHGRITAIVEDDSSVRPGVVSMTHGFGGLPDESTDYQQGGACTNLLVSTDRDLEPINSMPRMSGIPVNIQRAS